MNVLAGYGLLLLYFVIVFLLIGRLVKKHLGVVVSRKIIHILTGFSWFIYDIFIGCSFHQIIICLIFILVAIFSKKFNIIKTIENSKNDSNGTIYYSIALFILMTISYFVPSVYPLVGFSIIALAVGDGSATLIGKYVKSIKIYHDKTLFGFLACILFTFLGLIAYNFLYCDLFSLLEIFLLSVIAGIFEEEDLKGFDNVSVSLATFAVMILFENCENILIPIAIFCLIFLICFFGKIMTYHGSLLSSFIGASFLFIAGWKVSIYVISLYVLIIIIHVIRKILKVHETGIVKKEKRKDLMQVTANGIVSLIFIYLYLFISNKTLLIISLLVFSNSFVDSLASDIGSMSKKKPFDIFRKQFVEPGTSGGISLLGTISSFVGSVIFAVSIYFLTNSNYIFLAISPCIMMFCCFLDSFLGSFIQVKYKCDVCGFITEKEYHCDHKLEVYKGIKFFDNDMVNLSSSVVCGLLSLCLLVL